MKQIINVLFLLLILSSIPYSNQLLTQTNFNWQISYDIKSSTPETQVIYDKEIHSFYDISLGIGSETEVICWARLNFTSKDNTNSKNTRWFMMQTGAGKKTDLLSFAINSPKDQVTAKTFDYYDLNPFDTDSYGYFAYRFDDNSSLYVQGKNMTDYCNDSSSIMLTIFSSYGDSIQYNLRATTGFSNPTNQLSTIYEQLIPISHLNKGYYCFNITSDSTPYLVPYLDSVVENKTFYTNSSTVSGFKVETICQPFLKSSVERSQGDVFSYIKYFSPINYTYSLNDIAQQHTDRIILTIRPLEIAQRNQANPSDVISDAIVNAFLRIGGLFKNAVYALPEPIPTILKSISMLVDIVILLLSMIVIYQAVKVFFAFRRKIKTSLTAASIILIQIFIWLMILFALFYTITNTVPFCGLKGGVTIFALKQLGVEFKAPQSITDAPALLWDVALFGFVSSVSADCVSYFNVDNQIFPMICEEGSNGCPSMVLRINIIIVFMTMIIIILGIIWTLAMHIFTRVKSLETKVRGPDYEYEEEEIE